MHVDFQEMDTEAEQEGDVARVKSHNMNSDMDIGYVLVIVTCH